MSAAAHSRPATIGWFKFAAILFTIAGIANIVWGLHALDHKEGFIEGGLMWTTLKTWGWIGLVWGVVVLITGLMLFRNSGGAAGLGVLLAMASATFWLFVLPALPLFSVLAIALNVTVIYGLIVGVGELD